MDAHRSRIRADVRERLQLRYTEREIERLDPEVEARIDELAWDEDFLGAAPCDHAVWILDVLSTARWGLAPDRPAAGPPPRPGSG